MRSVTLEKKAAAQAGPLCGGETEHHSSGNSERDAYNMVSLAAIEERFPILARHIGVEILAGAA